ncbi:hypothetical protein GF327_07715 [Candidatus Woesearchaeota archaeon]|nr:hypothetical protein [Candidatus Woesearchaeota archaeon]
MNLENRVENNLDMILGGAGPASLGAALLLRHAIDKGWLPNGYKVGMFYAGPSVSERVLGNYLFDQIDEDLFENEEYKNQKIVDLINAEIINYAPSEEIVRDFLRFDLTDLGDTYRNSSEENQKKMEQKYSERLKEPENQWFEEHDFTLEQFRKFRATYKGAGGAGTGADGKHHFDPVLSMELFYSMLPHIEDDEEKKHILEVWLNRAEHDLVEIGGLTREYSPKGEDRDKIEKIKRNHIDKGIDLIERRTRHMGTDHLPEMIFNLMNYIKGDGENFQFYPWSNIESVAIEDNSATGVVLREPINGTNLFYAKDQIVLGFGRRFAEEAVRNSSRHNFFNKHLVKTEPRDTLFGGRVVYPAELTSENAEKMYEGIKLVELDDESIKVVFRSFCPCEKGNAGVAFEFYAEDICAVNGHAQSEQDFAKDIANSAFVLKLSKELIEKHHPGKFNDSSGYVTHLAKKISRYAHENEGDIGKPLVMRLKDIVEKNPTLNDDDIAQKGLLESMEFKYKFGDIRQALAPDEYGDYDWLVDLYVQGIKKFAQEGIYGEELLEKGIVVFPEFKAGRNHEVVYDKSGRHIKGVKNLHLIGDFAGLSGNVVGAMVTGYQAVAKGLFDADARQLFPDVYQVDDVTDTLIEKQRIYHETYPVLKASELNRRYENLFRSNHCPD